eukprot:7123137-Pyramimonas_sp.AAC.1
MVDNARSPSSLRAQCHHADWGAMKGNSCLQEAFLRALGEELARFFRMTHVDAMLDVEAFYDSIPWRPLVEAALALECVAVVLNNGARSDRCGH